MSSRYEGWRVVTPAPPSAALALAGPRARVRRGVLAQVRSADSAAVYLGDRPMALAMFGRHGWRRIEMALCIAPEAVPHMRRLVRLAQLTLYRLAEDRIVVALVRPGHLPGERMAAMVGFRRARTGQAGWWVFRRGEHVQSLRQRRRETGPRPGAEDGAGKP